MDMFETKRVLYIIVLIKGRDFPQKVEELAMRLTTVSQASVFLFLLQLQQDVVWTINKLLQNIE